MRGTAFGMLAPLAAIACLKLVFDAEIFLHLKDRGLGELRRTALLLAGEQRFIAFARFAFGAFGAALLFVVSQSPGITAEAQLGLSVVTWLLLLGGEVCERTLFFTAQSSPKMPGAVGP
jgi:hypothetical protein